MKINKKRPGLAHFLILLVGNLRFTVFPECSRYFVLAKIIQILGVHTYCALCNHYHFANSFCSRF